MEKNCKKSYADDSCRQNEYDDRKKRIFTLKIFIKLSTFKKQ